MRDDDVEEEEEAVRCCDDVRTDVLFLVSAEMPIDSD